MADRRDAGAGGSPQRRRGGPHSGPRAARGEEGLGRPRGGVARGRVRGAAAARHSGAPGLRRGSGSSRSARRGAGGLLAARGHRGARPRQAGPRAAVQVRRAGPGGRVPTSSSSLPRDSTSLRSTVATPPTPACARSSPNRPRGHQRRLPALQRRRRHRANLCGLGWIGPSFISAPSAPTCSDVPAVAAAPSGASTPPASWPRRAWPSSAARSPRGCCPRRPHHRSCSSRCDAHRPLHARPPRPRHRCVRTPSRRLLQRPTSPETAPLPRAAQLLDAQPRPPPPAPALGSQGCSSCS